jgi:hypothetical protein
MDTIAVDSGSLAGGKQMKRIFWIIVVLSLLSACQPTTASTPAPPPTPTPAPTSTPAPKPIPSPGTGEDETADAAPRTELVIVYGRSGGLAGIAETWEIYAGGGIVFTRGDEETELQIASEEVEALLAELAALRVFDAEAQEPPLLGTGADRITYSLEVYREPGKPQTITMVDGASDLPEGVQDAFKAVDDLIARASQ